MKSYKAVVIDGKKLLNKGIKLSLFLLLSSLLISSIKPQNIDFKIDPAALNQKLINESLPQVAESTESNSFFEEISSSLKKVLSFFMTFDVSDPRSIPLSQIPFLDHVSKSYLATQANGSLLAVFNPAGADLEKGEAEPKSPKQGEFPITSVDSSQEKTLKNSKAKILIRNETSFGINIEDLLASSLNIDKNSKGPKVLIVHTHTTESYSPEGASTYTAGKSDRSLDETQNMIAVGSAMKAVFDKYGIEAVHDKTIHDHPSFNGSYANSLKTIEKNLAKYPSISVVLDIHRDAFVYENGSKAKFVTKINGEDTAQLMFVVGTNAGGLDHPNWRENMKLALKFQDRITEKYPTLMRGVNLRKERFNGHTSLGSMIIEVGSSGNTLSEAIRGAVLGAEEISAFLNEL